MFQLRTLLVVVSLAVSAMAQTSDDIPRMVGAIMTRGGASDFLETLTDTVGGRLTGSPQDREAADLILKALRDAGYDNAHLEEYEFATGWQRGPISAEVLSPIKRRLYVGSYAWVPGTPGRVEAPVIDLGTPTTLDFPVPAEKLRGAAVLTRISTTPTPGALSYFVLRSQLTKKLAEAGAAAMLIVSDKPNRMVYTSAYGFYPHGGVPALSIASEDAHLLERLLAKGPVRISLDVQNTFGPAPAKDRNVVADLPGTDPSEMVIMGGHFDSWDPAQGANDNGSGIAQVLEAARVMKSLGIKPRSTIRFVFFSGEEEACLGSRAYVTQHRAELDRIRAVLITDSGAQAPLGFQVEGNKDIDPVIQKLLAPLEPLGANRVSHTADFESDYESFMVEGVPSLSLWVLEGDYDVRHHTIADTYEKVEPRILSLDTAVMAVAAYSIANAEKRPVRRLSPDEVQQMLKENNLLEEYKATYGK